MPTRLSVPTTGAPAGAARPFDFRRPNKLNRDHLRNLQIIFETFARQCSTVMSSSLRAIAHFSLTSVEQRSYDEYVQETPDPTHLSVLSMAPLPGASLLQVPLEVAFVAVDLMLGGDGRREPDPRPLTDIELGLTSTLIDRMLSELQYAFNSVVELRPAVVQHESNPQFAQVVAPSDMVVVVSFSTRVEAVEGTTTLCIPFTSLQPVLESFAGHLARTSHSAFDAAQMAVVVEGAVRAVPVELSVALPPVRLRSLDVTRLAVGDVVPFGAPVDEPVVASVHGEPLFLVRAARRGRRLVCQVVEVLDDDNPSTPAPWRPDRG